VEWAAWVEECIKKQLNSQKLTNIEGKSKRRRQKSTPFALGAKLK
jgi:hypothetical protein